MVQRELDASAPARSGGAVRTGGPVRTCVGCRERGLASDLLRVVAGESGPNGVDLIPDPRRRSPGRGAWLHPVPECLSLAERRRAFGRALRVSGPVDTSAIERHVAARAEHTGHHSDAGPFEENRQTNS
ncbi:YlxR family protein [Rhodococcus sp. HNM0569]|uniref:YlxR family protein n=1 Tax=Rhodococcus sp. HNM0569 TaxID=2716340 RepID=UPI00146A7DCB|nr:YlxR family protein [Rhodococcus sp. HNM0569]NLU81480.1 YlxR family protein [Rhodococcus sp. HNM0569]